MVGLFVLSKATRKELERCCLHRMQYRIQVKKKFKIMSQVRRQLSPGRKDKTMQNLGVLWAFWGTILHQTCCSFKIDFFYRKSKEKNCVSKWLIDVLKRSMMYVEHCENLS